MAHEDDLLSCLLDVAEAELNSLNRTENGMQLPSLPVPANKHSNLLKDVDLFSVDNIEEKSIKNAFGSNDSLIHDGFTDSSEDEANRHLEKNKYSESWKSTKNSIHSKRPSNTISNLTNSHSRNSSMRSWNSNSSERNVQENSSKPSTTFDTMFGIRVVNPVISSKTLEDKMIGRKVVPIQQINNHLKALSKNEDWVIAGVICSKGTTRTSAKGNQFMIWTISDLRGDIKTVALFLFGSAYEQFWKTQPGSVIGVLNPSVLDKNEGSRDEATLSVDNSQKLLILGQSKDLGTCKSTKKNGDKCTVIVNKNDCEYCVYHIKREYQKCSRRSELQANFSGKGLIALRNKVLGKNEVFYAGKSYTAIPAKQSRKLIKKDKDRLQSLSGIATTSSIKKMVVNKSAASFDVGISQRLKDMDILKKLGVTTEQFKNVNSKIQNNHSNEVSLDGAKANALKVLSKLKNKNEKDSPPHKENSKLPHAAANTKNETLHTSINQKIENNTNQSSNNYNKYELLQKSLDEIVQTEFVDLDVDYKKSRSNFKFTASSSSCSVENNLKEQSSDVHSVNKRKPEVLSNASTPSPSIRKISSVEKDDALQKIIPKSCTSQSNTEPVFSQTLLKSTFPLLSNNKGVVDLSNPFPKKLNKAKLSALKYIEKNGPIEKSNPNSVRGKGLKRSLDTLNLSSEKISKLQKIQENEHLSERFKKMMELQSKHMDLVELRDNEEKEKYFKKQEVKEKMEEKMANTYKIECKAVRCLDCKYTNFSAADNCKAMKHRLVYRDAMKRFFKCSNCGNRTACLDIVPLHPCKNCGNGKWERTTMMREKNITNSVMLSIRGGEQKFINDAVTDANINLLVPDES